MTWLQTLWAAWRRRERARQLRRLAPPHTRTLAQLQKLMEPPTPRKVIQMRVLRRPESRQRKEA